MEENRESVPTEETLKTEMEPRPPNAYILFCLEHRSEVQKRAPNMTNKQITIILGKKWKELKDEEKEPYRTKARQLQVEFKKKYPMYGYFRARSKRCSKQINPPFQPDIGFESFDYDFFKFPTQFDHDTSRDNLFFDYVFWGSLKS